MTKDKKTYNYLRCNFCDRRNCTKKPETMCEIFKPVPGWKVKMEELIDEQTKEQLLRMVR